MTRPSQRPPPLPLTLTELCPCARRQVYRNDPRPVQEGRCEHRLSRVPPMTPCGGAGQVFPLAGDPGVVRAVERSRAWALREEKGCRNSLPQTPATLPQCNTRKGSGSFQSSQIVVTRKSWAEGEQCSQQLWRTGPGHGASVPWATKGERP